MSTQRFGAAGRSPEFDLFAFDRYDRWALTAILGLTSVGAFAVNLARPLVGWAQGGDLRVPFVSDIAVSVLDGTELRHGPGSYDAIIPDPTATQRVLDLLPGLGWLALIVAGCWILLKVMDDVGKGDPFQPRNVRRLRVLAALIIAGWPLMAIFQDVAASLIIRSLDLGDPGLEPSFHLQFVPLFVGLVVALLAEAFKTGSRLRDDTDGLV